MEDKLSLRIKALEEEIFLCKKFELSISYYFFDKLKKLTYDKIPEPRARIDRIHAFIIFTILFLLFHLLVRIFPVVVLELIIAIDFIISPYIFFLACQRKMMDRPKEVSSTRFTICMLVEALKFFACCILSFFVVLTSYYYVYENMQSFFFENMYDLLPDSLTRAINRFDNISNLSNFIVFVILVLYIGCSLWISRNVEWVFLGFYREKHEWKNFRIDFLYFLAVAILSFYLLNTLSDPLPLTPVAKSRVRLLFLVSSNIFFFLIVFSKYESDKKLIDAKKL